MLHDTVRNKILSRDVMIYSLSPQIPPVYKNSDDSISVVGMTFGSRLC